MSFPLGQDTITRLRAPVVTDTVDNAQIRDWDNATETVIRNCMVQPFLLTDKLKIEENEEREFAEDTWRVWAPAGTDILYTDRILFDGEEYEVRGISGKWRDLDGVSSHVNFMIRQRRG